MVKFNKENQLYGRRVVTTHRRVTGDLAKDIPIVKAILKEALPVHEQNVREEIKLFNIYFNDKNWWDKFKVQRQDINNKVSIPTAMMLTRTINGYLYTEPVKYTVRDSDGDTDKQKWVESLSAMLDFMGNHNSNIAASLCASICGLGYKLCLPANKDELEETGIPFKINKTLIYPMEACMIVSDDVIAQDIMGFMIGTYYNEDFEPAGNQYTCWTKDYQFVLKDSDTDESGFEIVPQYVNGEAFSAYPLMAKKIPLVELERNVFRKGDWEAAYDLLVLKNKLLSNREDDIEQVLDYVLVLMNAGFEDKDDKDNVFKNRIIQLEVKNPQNPPSIEILKNPLDQTAIQTFANYIDLLIQECVGIPNRQENGYGGGDTGQAVKYRNGFRDLENNAGMIIGKMDIAELKFLALCIKYCKNVQDKNIKKKIGDLMPYDIRCKFPRSLSDDITASANAFATYVKNGVAFPDAFILSHSGTDAAELTTNALKAYENGTSYLAMTTKEETSTEVIETETSGNEQVTV